MSPQIIAPGQLSVPMGVQLTGFETPSGIALETLRSRMALVALHALLGRSSSTLVPIAGLARAAVQAADELLAALAVPSASSAIPPAAAADDRKG